MAAASAIPKTTAPQRVARAAGVQAQQEAQAAQARADLTAGLDRALRDTGKLPPLPGPAAADKQLPLLPRAIYREDALNKLLDVTKASVKDEVVSDVRFSPREIMSFAQKAAQTFTLPQKVGEPALFAAANSDPSASDKMVRAYLVAYQQGKFVTRDGVALARPDFKGGIGNPTITGFLTVVLEAMFDAKLRVPVFFEKDDKGSQKWLNAKGKTPTAATWDQTLAMEATAQTNVTLREARAIQVFSGMAADRSGAISSALVRSFGGAELSVVIGGKFSIGDNETLAKVVDTWVEATSRRLAEAVFYKQFLSPGEPDGIQDMLDLIEWVAKQS